MPEDKYGLTRSKRGNKKNRLWRRLSCPQAGEERIPDLNQRPGTMSDMVMDFNSALYYAGITAMMLPSTSGLSSKMCKFFYCIDFNKLFQGRHRSIRAAFIVVGNIQKIRLLNSISLLLASSYVSGSAGVFPAELIRGGNPWAGFCGPRIKTRPEIT